MRLSNAFFKTMKDTPADAEVKSHQLMLRAGFIHKLAAGIYTYMPMGLRIIHKISQIIREELEEAGAQEISMPMVQPAELWKESGRWGVYGDILLRLKDRKGGDFCLGPTHEEVVTAVARSGLKSYKQLPQNLFQIQTKFRDELRPRFGLMRGREFLMKDAYSFDLDKKGAEKSYDLMYKAYHRIFERCGLKFAAVDADSGDIGGSKSHEFQVLADSGEDEIIFCEACGYAANVEKADTIDLKDGRQGCSRCQEPVVTKRGIEVGHIFHLGTKYSVPMKAEVLGPQGQKIPMEMGCYGIGVSRVMAACIEQNHDEKGMIWPVSIAPYEVAVVSLGKDEPVMLEAERIYNELKAAGVDALFDDRPDRPGAKFKDQELLGLPFVVYLGRNGLSEGVVEFSERNKLGQKIKISLTEIVSHVKEGLKNA